jgi:hypothetical protein
MDIAGGGEAEVTGVSVVMLVETLVNDFST